jgi:hypothetical protein
VPRPGFRATTAWKDHGGDGVRPTRKWRRVLGVEHTVIESVGLEPDGRGGEVFVAVVRPKADVARRCSRCQRRCPGYDTSPTPRRRRGWTWGRPQVYLQATTRRVTCPEHGVVVCRGVLGRPGARFTPVSDHGTGKADTWVTSSGFAAGGLSTIGRLAGCCGCARPRSFGLHHTVASSASVVSSGRVVQDARAGPGVRRVRAARRRGEACRSSRLRVGRVMVRRGVRCAVTRPGAGPGRWVGDSPAHDEVEVDGVEVDGVT